MSRQDKATTERHTRILRELVKRPENKTCADCKRHDPRWASWNIGVFMCIRCSGIHRSMGTHISKVKSVDLDTWTPEQMASIQKWGNVRANLYWEAHLKSGHVPPDHKVESFIRSKYESRRWAMDGPPPDDPSVLESGQQEAEPAPVEAIQRQQSPVQQSQKAASTSRTAHPLLSTSLMSGSRAQPAQAAVAASRSPPLPAAPAPPPPAPQDDLFSLDFNPAPTMAATNVQAGPRKDVKNDIMSLFGSGAAAQPAPVANQWGGGGWGAPAAQQSPPAASVVSDPWGSFSSAPTQQAAPSFFGATSQQYGQPQQQGLSMFPPAQQNVWGTPAAAAQPSSNPWGGFSAAPAQSAAAPQPAAVKKDDPFGDLWN